MVCLKRERNHHHHGRSRGSESTISADIEPGGSILLLQGFGRAQKPRHCTAGPPDRLDAC